MFLTLGGKLSVFQSRSVLNRSFLTCCKMQLAFPLFLFRLSAARRPLWRQPSWPLWFMIIPRCLLLHYYLPFQVVVHRLYSLVCPLLRVLSLVRLCTPGHVALPHSFSLLLHLLYGCASPLFIDGCAGNFQSLIVMNNLDGCHFAQR